MTVSVETRRARVQWVRPGYSRRHNTRFETFGCLTSATQPTGCSRKRDIQRLTAGAGSLAAYRSARLSAPRTAANVPQPACETHRLSVLSATASQTQWRRVEFRP